jgi:hypothetical protein
MLQLGMSTLLGNQGTFSVLLWGIGLFLQVMDEHVVFLYVKDRGGVDNWWQGKVKILIIHPLVVFERNV